MAAPAALTHMFAELYLLEDLGSPLKGSSRIRFTCMSVSRRYIALGCNTGGVYVFGRDSLKHLQSIYGDVDACPVSVVAVSPNELNVGFAVSSGQVVVMEMNIERRSKPERLRQTTDHSGSMVTTMVWDASSSSLFVGDSTGKVTHINVPTSKAKTIFSQPSQTIVRLDCGLTQLDWWGNKLLASSLTRTYLLNTTKQQFSQIGKKPREGEFGACFYLEPSSKYPVIYCARPGSRMWEVDFEGNVLNTHQFKQLLDTQPLPIIAPGMDFVEALKAPLPGPQSVNFLQMLIIGEYILTWSSRGLYVFDPINVKVVLWTDALRGIKDVCIIKNEIYVFLDSQKVRRLVFLPILHLCAALVTRQRCLMAADLLLFMEHFAVKPALLKHVKKELLPQLLGLLREVGRADVGDKVQAMLEDVSESSMDSVFSQDDGTEGLYPLYTTQTSGIVVVSDGALSFGDPERRRSPNRFSPVSLQHGGSSRASPLSDPESKEHQAADRSEKSLMKSEWAANIADTPQSVSGTLDSSSYTPDPSVYADFPEVVYETREYTEMSTNDALDRERGYSADSDRNSEFRPDGREEMDSPISAFSEQTSQPDIETKDGVSEVNEENATEQERNFSNQNTMGDGSVADAPVSVRESLYEESLREGIMIKRENVEGKTDDNQNSLLMRDRAKEKPADNAQSTTDLPGIRGVMRKVNSMPEIVVEDPDKPGDTEVREGGASRKSSLRDVPSPVRRASSGFPAESIATTVKKKKRRRVNEGNIMWAGSSKGQMNRTQSTDSLKQKKKKEVVQPTRPTSWSPQDPCSLTTTPDMDTISLASIGSIEEESSTVSHTTPQSPRSVLDEDVFAPPASKETSSSKEILGVDEGLESASLGEEIDMTTFAVTHNAGFSDSDSETVPQQQSFPEDIIGQAGRHGDSKNVEMSMELAGSGSYPEGGIVPFVNSLSEQKTMSDASRSMSVEKLPFRVSDLDSEVIPPLIERLSALGVAPASLRSEEAMGNIHDLSSMKSLITEASKQKIASVRERVTKFSSSTKSLIRRVKEKNPLMAKSPYGSPPFGSGSLSNSKDYHDLTDILYTDTTALPSMAPELPPSCPISLQPLLAQTEQTQRQLRDHSLLLNQDNLKATLNTWAAELNRTLAAYHQEMQRQQAQQQKGKTADKHSANELSSGVEKMKNSVNENEEAGTQSEEQTHGQADLHSEGGQRGGVISGVHDDSTQARDRSETASCQDVGDSAGQGMDPEEESRAQNHTDGEDSVSGVSVTPHSTVLHTGHSISENGLTTASEQMPAEQSISDQSDSSLVKVPGVHEDDVSGNQVRTEMSSEKDATFSLTTSPADESVSDPDEKLPIDWSQVCHVKDPFKLTPLQHTAISTLVSYCLDCQCFGNASTFFSLHTSEPEITGDKEQASETVPSSFMSYTNVEANASSSYGKCLNHISSEEPHLLHRHPTNANHDDSLPHSDCDPHKCSPVADVYAEHISGAQEVCPFVDERSLDPAIQYSLLRDDGKSTKLCQDAEASRRVSKYVGGRQTNDEERALFVRLHYHFIPHWRLRQMLTEADVSKVHVTWRTLITCCQELGHGDAVWLKIRDRDLTGALDYLRSGILPNKQAFLGHIASLFEMNALRVTDFLCEVPRQVRLGDILHLCHLHSKPVQQVVSRYLALRLGATPFTGRLEILRQMCVSTEVKLAVLECLLHLRSTTHSSSASSLSGPDTQYRASTDLSRFSPDMVKETLECVLTLLNDGECSRALEACWQYSYWPGCLKLLKQTDQWQKALQLEVKLNDINLLNGHISYGLMPRDLEQWQYLFHLYQQESAAQQSHQEPSSLVDAPPPAPPPSTPATSYPPSIPTEMFVFPPPSLSPQHVPAAAAVRRDRVGQTSDTGMHSSPRTVASSSEATDQSRLKWVGAEKTAVDGSHELSWLSLGLLAAHHVGASSAVQLLQSCVERQEASAAGTPLSADFYRTCLALSALHNQQKLVVHNMLEKVDSYLWAKKPVHLTPQVYYAATQEKSAVHNRSTDDRSYHTLFARLSSAPVVEQPLAEDPDCHWGVHTNIVRTCEACGVEVNETVSLLEPGVFIFKCGHVFHKFCIPGKECPLC